MKSLSVAVLVLANGGALGSFAYQPIEEALYAEDVQSAPTLIHYLL